MSKRRFKALAAALEVLEDTFSALSRELEGLVVKYRDEYASGGGRDDTLDVARLYAFLEFYRPDGEGWRAAERAGRPFPPGSAPAGVEVLAGANIQTARQLTKALSLRGFQEACATFAAREGIAVSSISHLALVVLAAGAANPTLVTEQFPEMVFSPSVIAAIEATRRSISARNRA
jgi:hypothetical protein